LPDVRNIETSAKHREDAVPIEPLAGPFLVDAHTHIYDCFDKAAFFRGASANFQHAARHLGRPSAPIGCLLLTERQDGHYFRQIYDGVDTDNVGGWVFSRTAEDCSLLAQRHDGSETELLIVAGRQVATRERLEVLALGTGETFSDGLALPMALAAVVESGAVAVLPWGFGKWWFDRGRQIRNALDAGVPGQVFVGDNGGRPGLIPRPKQFGIAARRGIFDLPGSDPLPFRSEEARAGSFGFILDGAIDRLRPADGLKKLIRRQSTQPTLYGQQESVQRFVVNQLRIHALKRTRSGR